MRSPGARASHSSSLPSASAVGVGVGVEDGPHLRVDALVAEVGEHAAQRGVAGQEAVSNVLVHEHDSGSQPGDQSDVGARRRRVHPLTVLWGGGGSERAS